MHWCKMEMKWFYLKWKHWSVEVSKLLIYSGNTDRMLETDWDLGIRDGDVKKMECVEKVYIQSVGRDGGLRVFN